MAKPKPESTTTPPPTQPKAHEPPPNRDWREDAGNVGVSDDAIESFPALQWVNGKPDADPGSRSAWGGFFVGQESCVPVLPDSGWEPHTFRARDGTEVDGHYRRDVEVTIIRDRRSFTVDQPGARRPLRFPWNGYAQAKRVAEAIRTKPRGHVQLLCLVRGLTGLVTVGLKGMQTNGMTDRDGWAWRVRKFLLNPASAEASRVRKDGKAIRLPFLCFRIVIGPARDGDKPVYRTVGTAPNQSTIVDIDVIKPAGPVEVGLIGSYYVGHAMRRENEATHMRTSAWATAWDAFPRDWQGSAGSAPPPGYEDGGAPGDDDAPGEFDRDNPL
jgi:hypothetical protein